MRMAELPERHQKNIRDAADCLVAVVDDCSIDLIEVIAEMERYIVEETKVGDAAVEPVPEGRAGYTMRGRLVRIQ